MIVNIEGLEVKHTLILDSNQQYDTHFSTIDLTICRVYEIMHFNLMHLMVPLTPLI